MTARRTPFPAVRLRALISGGLLAAVALACSGCFDEPKIEDRWTRVDLGASSLAPYAVVSPATLDSITVSTSITYRAIVTGVAVAELRASSTLSASDVALGDGVARTAMASDIDRILAQSVSLGRATRAITGWDHLIQHLDFHFRANASAPPDSNGMGARGFFLLCYLGDGERVERADGSDTLIVTPFVSSERQVLPIGFALTPPAGAMRVER